MRERRIVYQNNPKRWMKCKPCLAITSQEGHSRYEYQIAVINKAGLLFNPSWILVDKVFTTEDQFIKKKLGELDPGELSDVLKMLENIIK